MIQSDQVTAVLFAGGQSSRMGRDKAMIPWGEPPRPLWRVQLEKLARLSPGEIFISARPGIEFDGAEVLLDETPGAGPLAALAGCLARAQRPYVLPLAVDMPAVTPALLEQLEETAGPGGLVYRDGKFFEPFPALYPRALLPLAEECLADGQDSMQRFINEAISRDLLHAAELPPDQAPLFKSLNTPDDLSGD